MTKAHVFAKSWTKLFDEPNETEEHEVVHHYVDPATGARSELKRARTFALMSRRVCGDCNGGWLKALEERVLPLMQAFAGGHAVSLSIENQSDLALWAAAAAVIAMSQDPIAEDFAAPEFSHVLYRVKEPPPGTEIWLGANVHGEMGWFASHSLRASSLPVENDHGWGALLSLGHSVFYVLHHGVPDQRLRLRGHVNRALRTIWTPRATTSWPTKALVRPRDLAPLVDEVVEHSTWERSARAAS